MFIINGQYDQEVPGLTRRARAAAKWIWSTRRRRSDRVLARNAQWASEARQAPSIWPQ